MPRVSAITDNEPIGGIPRGSTLALGIRKRLGAGTEYGFTDLGVGEYTEAHPMAGTYQKRVTGYNQFVRYPTKHRQTYYVQMRDTRSGNPKTPAQQRTRLTFRIAMAMWRELPPEEKEVWNKKAVKVSRYGVHLFLKETIRSIDVNELINAMWPVGSIYWNGTSAELPPSLAAVGTWERYALGRAVIGYDPDDPDYDDMGVNRGQKTINLEHSHTVNSHNHTVPAHNHTLDAGRALVQISNSSGRVFTSQAAYVGWNNTIATGTTTPITQSYAMSNATKLAGTTDNSAAANTGDATAGMNSQLSSAQNIEGPGVIAAGWIRTA